ncbi:MAG: glycosyltransferase family 2 protein [Candidatus Berkelbacteria bacterium]|nr:glycosyltransferase family 2 protein [Candidatus Berkelbacteria bacterium]
MKTFVVIAAFNEEKKIQKILHDVRRYCQNIIVVDDGSEDKTFNLIRKCRVVSLRHLFNRGQGAALKTGIDLALNNGAEIIITFDADGQMSPKEIPRIVKPILDGKADVVLGSRFLDIRSNIPFSRKLILKMAIFFTKITTGLELTDSHNGFRAMTAEVAKRIDLQQDRMAHASEILNEVAKKKFKIMEIPVTVKYSEYSLNKGQKASGFLKIILDLFFDKFI